MSRYRRWANTWDTAIRPSLWKCTATLSLIRRASRWTLWTAWQSKRNDLCGHSFLLDSKIAGITRFLYQFLKISPKYCGKKEKDHNILWSKWYSRRESNPQRPLRRGLLYPFNYGSFSGLSCADCKQTLRPLGNAIILHHSHQKSKEFCGRMPAKFPIFKIMRKCLRPCKE